MREWIEARLETPRWSKFVKLMRTYAMPLYLLHTSGLAIFLVGGYFLNQRAPLSTEISWRWWAWRPLAVTLPLITTLPLLWAVAKLVRASKKTAAIAAGAVSSAAEAVSEAARNIAEKLD